jgi:ribosomal-protein-alanine N-acetyltransferase
MDITLRPVRRDDLDLLRRFSLEPDLLGYDWPGFQDSGRLARQFDENGLITEDLGRLMVDAEGSTAGLVSYTAGRYAGRASYWEIGIVLLPEFRGRGAGWRAQAMLTDYLFRHTPAQRVQAGTHPENLAEQNALVKAGFQLEGVVRAAEFRDGAWRDGLLYSRLRDDPAPEL